MKACPHCQAPNRPTSQFCVSCGRPLSPDPQAAGSATVRTGVAVCPQCQAPVRPHARFCPACSYPLQGAAPEARAAEGQRPTLTVHWPGGRSEEHPLHQNSVHVGRGADNDIILNFPTVSSHHLRLDVSNGDVLVTDLGSTNGTMVNGQQIAANTPRPLPPGGVIRVGDLRGNSISMSLKGQQPRGAPPTQRLHLQDLAHYNRFVIGREAGADLHLDHATVSRQHAEVVRRDGNYAIRDLGSANGTFVDGTRISGWVTLGDGAVVQIGPYKLVFSGDLIGGSQVLGHRLDVIDLGKEVSGGKMILEDISLAVHAGEFISLVGGSGAGKSTLLKAMNGFNPATHGQMLIDGEALYSNLEAYRTLMGYVPQDDIIHRNLTVYRALWYSARLRLPDASSAEIEQRIQEVLEMVDMTAHKDKRVKVLSGGQRKRVSIAVELLAQPDLLFLDEPTSGLDPGLEKKMMYDLNRLADRGKTVVLVTHATANIEQCDHVAFLERGHLSYYGPPQDAVDFFEARDFADIYLKLSEEVDPTAGKPVARTLEPYYQRWQMRNHNARLTAGILWADHYRTSPHYRQYVSERQRQIQPAGGSAGALPPGVTPERPRQARDSMFRQIGILGRRHLELIRNDMRTLFVLLLMMPIIGLLFMFVSNEDDLTGWQDADGNRLTDVEAIEGRLAERLEGEPAGETENYMPMVTATQLITMFGLALTQAGTFGAAAEIVKERAIFKRERSVNLKVTGYVLSKVLVLGLFAVVQVASVLLILSLKVDMSFEPVFGFFPNGASELFVSLLIAVMASVLFGLFISAAVPSQDVVLYIILIQLFAQIILSGAMFPLESPAAKLMISHWTMDAIGSSVDLPQLNELATTCTVINEGASTPRERVRCESASQEELDLDYEHTEEHLVVVWGALLAMAVAWGGATMVVQARRKMD